MRDRNASLRDMLLAFLRAEIDSPTEAERVRHALATLGASEEMILGDLADTETLFTLFKAYRGGEALFDGLSLRELDWCWMNLTLADLRVKTLTCRHHFEREYGTRQPAEIAQARNLSQLPNGVMEKVLAGSTLEPPVLIGCPDLSRLVILEGHNRLVSYLRAPMQMHFPVLAIVGTGDSVSDWCEWY